MEQETIQAVRQAEADAEQIEKQAATNQRDILEKAHTEAAELVKQMTSAAKAQAKSALDAAQRKGEIFQQEAVKSAEQEIAALREAAKSKSAEARKLILCELT